MFKLGSKVVILTLAVWDNQSFTVVPDTRRWETLKDVNTSLKSWCPKIQVARTIYVGAHAR